MTTITTSKNEVLNLTTLVFNDRLKAWVINIKDNYDLSQMQTWTLDKMLEVQADIRDRFIRTSYEGILENGSALSKGNKDYPNIYALFILLISEIESCNNWNDVMEHVKRDTNVVEYINLSHLTPCERFETSNDGMVLLNESSKIKYNCLCGHYVKTHLYKIRNTKTHLEVWCGCDCIEKSKIISAKELKACKEKYERKRLAEIRQREQLEEQDRRNKERLIAYQRQQVEQQKAIFSQIIKVFESPYVLQKHKEMRQGRRVLFNIILKSRTKS